jgi:uncharacterized protein YdiU (UPF0061 family)
VRRETLLPGAILTRIAASHLRVGTFQYFATHGTTEMVRQLADYAIARHDPDLVDSPQRHADFLRSVGERQAALLAQWMHVGFIHGVMNTDNMGIPGETIDYGPCAFMEAYDPRTVFSSIDAGGRYAYAAQPGIARWNLARLAEALLPLFDTSEGRAIEIASAVIDAFPERYHHYWLAGLRAKLGLGGELKEVADGARSDAALGESWLDLLHAQGVDYTLAWRRLADAAAGNEAPLRALFAAPQGLERWLERWRARCAAEDAAMMHDGLPAELRAELRAQSMRRVNPWLIARNQRVEEALEAASERGDLAPFEQLLAALRRPYDENSALARYAEPASGAFMADFRTYCGT